MSLHPLEQVLVDLRQRKRAKTVDDYTWVVKRFLAFAAGRPLTGNLLRDWVALLIADGASTGSVNTYVTILRTVSKRAVINARVNGVSMLDFTEGWERFPKEDATTQRRALTLDQVKQVLATCEPGTPVDLRDRALLTLGFRTGARRSSMQKIDLEQLRSAQTGFVVVGFELKGGRKINLPLDASITAAFIPWLRYLQSRKVEHGPLFRSFSGRARLVTGGRLSEMGDRLSEEAVYWIVRERGEQIGLKLMTHTLRYTAVSLLREAGVPDWKIALLTGHKPRLEAGSASGEGGPEVGFPMLDRYTRDLSETPIGSALPEF